MTMKAISDGTIIDVPVDDAGTAEITRLKTENLRLGRAVRDAEVLAARAQEDADRALANLRRQLGPLYRALQMVFGELDAAGVVDQAAPGPVSTPVAAGNDRAKWDEWKQRLGPSCAKVIDALLLGGEMNVEAIRIASRMARQTVYDSTSTLGRAGILTKSGGKFSLKPLA